jgi:hypothetical protein
MGANGDETLARSESPLEQDAHTVMMCDLDMGDEHVTSDAVGGLHVRAHLRG